MSDLPREAIPGVLDDIDRALMAAASDRAKALGFESEWQSHFTHDWHAHVFLVRCSCTDARHTLFFRSQPRNWEIGRTLGEQGKKWFVATLTGPMPGFMEMHLPWDVENNRPALSRSEWLARKRASEAKPS